ncbi:hypothetical protein N9V91_06245 [Acidimicrobiaceae bacterium]|nr:hypothetical protein [Acidimicrobiaceae bacterium]
MTDNPADIHDTLFLIKSSRIREYRQQNLAILSAPDGDIIETSYNARWVQPGLELQRGTGCAIVFADSPYQSYVPVRWGVVDSVEEIDGRIDLRVRLGTFIAHASQLVQRWNTDARADIGKPASERARPHFLFSEANPGIGTHKNHEAIVEARAAAIAALGTNPYFEASTLVQVLRVETVAGLPVEPGADLSVGDQINITFRVDTPAFAVDDRRLVVESIPPGAVTVDEVPSPLTDGDHIISATVRLPGQNLLRFNVTPDALLSSRPVVSLPTLASSSIEVPDGDRTVATSPGDSLQLINWLDREVDLAASQWRGLYEDVLHVRTSSDADLIRKYALALYEVGEYDGCRRQLERLSAPLPNDHLYLTLSALRSGAELDYASQIGFLNFETDRQFELMIEAMEAAPTAVMQSVAEPLWDGILGEDRKLDLLQRIWPFDMTPTFRYTVAENLAWNDPDGTVDMIVRRWNHDVIPDPFLTLLTKEIAARDERTVPYVKERVRRLVIAGQLDEAVTLVPDVRQGLTAAAATGVLAPLAHDLLASSDVGHQATAFSLVYEAVSVASAAGEIDAALEHADVLRGSLVVAPTVADRTAAEELLERLDSRLEESDELQSWKAMQNDSLYPAAATLCRNRVVHLVGGKRASWESVLASGLEADKLIWHEAEKHKSPTADWVDDVTADRDIVIVLTEHIGHALSGRVIDACKRRGVTWIAAKTGERWVLEALGAAAGAK